MADRVPNLDPQLEGSVQPRPYTLPQPGPDAFGGSHLQHNEGYKPEGPRPPNTTSYGSSAQPTPQPYYQYPTPNHHTVATGSVSSASAQPSPDHNTYPPQQSHQGLDQSPEDLNEQDPGGTDDSKRPRACEACRGLKVRCDQDPLSPDIPCKRCAKAGRACIITQPSRKRQKKADSRVAELEKKLDALTAVLNHRHASGSYPTTAQTPPMADLLNTRASIASLQTPHTPGDYSAEVPEPHTHSIDREQPLQKRRRTEDDMPEGLEARHVLSMQFSAPTSDVTRFLHQRTPQEFMNRINSLIPPAHGALLFKRYTTEMTNHIPAVVFPREMTAEKLFREKPILYLAIISAASFGQVAPEVSIQLQDENMGAIADCVVRNGAKSIELIQAMQVIALWYKPPDRAEQTNFYQIIHMAAVMALDIGLGKRFNSRKSRQPIGGHKKEVAFAVKISSQDSDTLEARRAWLICYYLCASASMVLRRPNLVRWTDYMKECIEVLETSPDAHPSDKLLCQHVKIQHICEEIGLQFLMDDNTAQISINDPKVSYTLNVLENQLKQWKQQIPEECRVPALTFFEHVTSLYLHEIALHFNHNVEDFRMPFTEDSLKNVNSSTDALSQNQIAAIEACLTAAHGILSTMVSLDLRELLAIPMLLFFVRCIYALVILIKMHVAISTPNSELGKIIKSNDLKIEYYMDRLLEKFTKVAHERKAKPEKVLRILGVLMDWFSRHKEALAAQYREDGTAPSAAPQSKQLPQAAGEKYGQTPLHMLSQIAAGQQQGESQSISTDWTVGTPTVLDYSRLGTSRPDGRTSSFQQNRQDGPSQQVSSAEGQVYDANIFSMMDPLNPSQDYGWGSGFEQAMDMTLGDMGGLQDGGLDNWFLGDSMAPFGFSEMGNTPAAGAAGQW